MKDIKRQKIATLEEFVQENDSSLNRQLIEDIEKHYAELINNFRFYFPDILENESWIRDPFSFLDTVLDNFPIQEIVEKRQLMQFLVKTKRRM